jgi:hypothetical protein
MNFSDWPTWAKKQQYEEECRLADQQAACARSNDAETARDEAPNALPTLQTARKKPGPKPKVK